MRDFQFNGTCVSHPFESDSVLCDVIDSGREITPRTFFAHCDVGRQQVKGMRRFPHDFTYHKSKHNGKPLYFFTWSCIEHFFMRR
jgi:hypothetical protein